MDPFAPPLPFPPSPPPPPDTTLTQFHTCQLTIQTLFFHLCTRIHYICTTMYIQYTTKISLSCIYITLLYSIHTVQQCIYSIQPKYPFLAYTLYCYTVYILYINVYTVYNQNIPFLHIHYIVIQYTYTMNTHHVVTY